MSIPSTLPVLGNEVQPRVHALQCGGDHRVCERVRARAVRYAEAWLISHVNGSRCVIRLAPVGPWELYPTAQRRLQALFADLGGAGDLDDKSRASIGLALAMFVVPAGIGEWLFEAVAERAHFEKMVLP